MNVTRKSSGAFSPRVKTLAAALAIALATAAGSHVDPVSASAMPLGSPTSKANWTSHAKFRKPSYDHLRAQFAALRQTAKPSAQSRAATTRAISSNADSGSGSLREALATAVDGDIIDLGNLRGTLSLSGSLKTDAMVEIRGPGRDALIIDAGHADRAFTASHGLRMSHVTVVNGATPHASANGGCLFVGGDLYLSDVSLSGCTAGSADDAAAYGGAISVDGYLYLNNVSVTNSTVTGYFVAIGGGISAIGNSTDGYYVGIYNSTISGNTATVIENYYAYLADGGGLAVLGSTDLATYPATTTISSSTISGNTAVVQSTYDGHYYPAAQGGGANFQSSVATISQSHVSGNSASAYDYAFGAGLSTSTPIYLSGSTVSGNTGSGGLLGYGGGVFSFAPITIDRSSVQGNSISGYIAVGGGVSSEGVTEITNSLFSGNTVSGTIYSTGGGVSRKYNSNLGPGSLTITNSTVSGNVVANGARDVGGGAYEQESLTVNNSTIAFNFSALYGGGAATNNSALITLNSSIIANNSAAAGSSADFYAYGGPIIAGGDHNLVIASDAGITLPPDTLTSDPKLLPLADNGGGTLTHALDPTSPAIDTGSNPLTLLFDQRGNPYARVVGAAADIGAYELDSDHIFGNGFE